jgi:hypothetical protein
MSGFFVFMPEPILFLPRAISILLILTFVMFMPYGPFRLYIFLLFAYFCTFLDHSFTFHVKSLYRSFLLIAS